MAINSSTSLSLHRRPGSRITRSYWAVAVAAVVGVALTLAAVETQRRAAQEKTVGEARLAVESRIKTLQTNLDRYEDLVSAVRAYIEGSGGALEAKEFNVVISGLLRGRAGIQALAYIPRVKASARLAYESVARDSGSKDFYFKERTADGHFKPASDRDEYFPVYNIEPRADDEALGFNTIADPERRAAMERARDSGKMAVTRRLKLVLEHGEEWGFLLVAPVYFPVQATGTLEERRANLAGFAAGVFRFGDTVESILNTAGAASGFDHYFFDSETPDPARLSYVHGSQQRPEGTSPLPFTDIRPADRIESSFAVGDRHWSVVTVPIATAEPFGVVELTTLIAGLVATGLVSLYLLGTIRRSVFFEALATDLRQTTKKLKREAEERQRAEERVNTMARNDALTELPNRRVFVEAVQQAIARKKRGATGFAVLYLDLDHFKDINDTLGHPVGDRLLKAVSWRLRASVRATDTIARFGGDEFAVLQLDLADPADAGALASKLLAALSEPFVLDDGEIRTSTSIGIAVYAADVEDAETMLAHADVALYRAKSEGRHAFRFFTEAMDQEVRRRFQLSNELRTAITANQLFLVYQPQVETDTGRILGVEALVRWRHPTRGLMPPVEFIPVAERTGLIIALGHWVLYEACRQAKVWLDLGIAPQIMAVNISALQLRTPLDLEKDVGAVLHETGLPARMLELELTESALMETSREHNDTLLRLRDRGIRLAIDDFGTGYSSLDYLRRFPVDRIKVAQEFMIDLTSEPGNAAIVKAAIGLARELGLNVIAEGVETVGQKDFLKTLGCNVAQGYYFAKPLPTEEMTALLQTGRVAPPRPVSVPRTA
jgi:diguanylate cyclase (GGDEF)-like protein